jgi:hypothetical protein
VEVNRFLNALRRKYQIIQGLGMTQPPVVPDGKDPIERFERYLTDSNPELASGNIEKGSKQIGASGKVRAFDMCIKGESTVVFVRLRGEKPELDDVKRMARDVNDVLDAFEKEREKRISYARAVMLIDYSDKGDLLVLDDEVVNALNRLDIKLGRLDCGIDEITHIQIVVDEGEMYSMVPFVPDAHSDMTSEPIVAGRDEQDNRERA